MLRCFETTITICACGWGNVFLVLAAMTVPSLMPPIFRLFGARLAVQGRYNVNLFHRVLSRSLQGIAERPLPCNYNVIQFAFTAVTRVQIPSGTPNLFRSLRGTATFGAGTKRHNSVANFLPGLPNRECFRASGAVLVGTKRHMQFSQIRRPATAGARNRRMALL